MTEAYPLHWPDGWPRAKRRQSAQFKTGLASARDGLMAELRRMGARYPVLSSNLTLRRDGLPYANQAQPADPGVAVYFEWKGRQMAFACDRWRKVEDNVQAVRKTIEAIRGIERWGASDMMERAFMAFEALPAPGARPWREVLGVNPHAYEGSFALKKAEEQYKRLAQRHHPDHGGDPDQMAEVNAAIAAARQELR